MAVSSAFETRSFSRSDSLAPFFVMTFLTSSSATPRAATRLEPHSGHFTAAGMSFTLRISTYFQQLVQTSVLTSFKIRALAEPTRIRFSFSVGIMSAFRLIRSSPILAIGVASPPALTVLTAISLEDIAFNTFSVRGTSMSFSWVSLTASSMMTVPSKLLASCRSVMLLKSVHLEIAPNLLATWTSRLLNRPVRFDAATASSFTSVPARRCKTFCTSSASTAPMVWRTIL